MKQLISWMMAVLCIVVVASASVARVVPPSGPRIVVLPPLNQTVDQFLRDGVGAGSLAGLAPGTLPLSAFLIAADGSAVDITPLVQWSFTGTAATLDEEGVLHRVGDGKVDVCVYFAGIDGRLGVMFEPDVGGSRRAPGDGNVPPAPEPSPEPRDVKTGMRALIANLEARGIPLGGLRLGINGSVVFVGQGWIGTNRLNRDPDNPLNAEFVTPNKLGIGALVGNAQTLADASGVVLLSDATATQLDSRDFFTTTGSLRTDIIEVLHKTLHATVNAAGGDGLIGSKAATEEAFVQVWWPMLPLVSDIGDIFTTATQRAEGLTADEIRRLKGSIQSLRNLFAGLATLCASLYPTNQLDQDACQVFVNFMLGLIGPGWTDNDGNGLPDFVDNSIRKYEQKHGPIPWGPDPPDNPTHPLPPRVPEEGQPRDLPNQPSGPPSPAEP